MTTQHFVIAQFRERDRRSMNALLIGGSEIVDGSEKTNDLGFQVALVTVGEGRAEMQADRFSSGLIGARPFETLDAVKADAIDDFGVDWSALTVPSL
ncbi:hypothetical protein GCM10025867_48770 (plasmid) [Frondihabitans sucicola]|uniref:YCII-related domain-containing protein n=1 Tax=Frondihabitans sucicola TaxID=1268041 RepID=A0ABM8GVY9_9MICO|nr:hypothetical protein [Frondihabitans sucicola]BDZ52636.1 hypothetical protein GCM10025867_48770 [Frondihabitans sucicola]